MGRGRLAVCGEFEMKSAKSRVLKSVVAFAALAAFAFPRSAAFAAALCVGRRGAGRPMFYLGKKGNEGSAY